MGTDMLVNLYNIDENKISQDKEDLIKTKVFIKRAMYIDKMKILKFVVANFPNWISECELALINNCCFIAAKNSEILGFACFNTTANGYFGPIGVAQEDRHLGIGKSLAGCCLLSMKEMNFGYAIIGWVEDAVDFYERSFNAITIPDSHPGIYSRMIE